MILSFFLSISASPLSTATVSHLSSFRILSSLFMLLPVLPLICFWALCLVLL
ncbi:uncharacterized protein ASPGLDRAFT_46715 [Aspergillus glaucus CBS 516.65]|uniref:Uncharacterized protein n=1 Tax=Aspergillus glaucus CBS 516.65 TaxID=1160497 RepID=A0A1L9VLK7_ASPGL|nr:hypothetical protein ASPGLDRAFT_46715 [Aspergillus glaucus CBS 516.65]OJJ84803.1 hypothetical protein ASPGLDRAFT_46715 [Aspergillus glaucus CBS 516.65]